MTMHVIITVCILLLLAYAFDITSGRTKIPSVILLLILGAIVKLVFDGLSWVIPDLNPVLPLFGTLGLVLIVLEGSLELEFHRSKLSFIGRSALSALLPLVLFSAGLGLAIQLLHGSDFKTALINAIPLAVISSSVAIPSARNLSPINREFVVYESSLSDIFGVILFNFLTLNDSLGMQSVGSFLFEILLILGITFVATLLLAYLLSRINHHIKYVPIILMLFLIYALAKMLHLPALIFILLFGIFLGNLDELKQFRFIRFLKPDILNYEVVKLKDLVIELTFLIRALFFLLFGFLIDLEELLNFGTLLWSICITAGIFGLRYIFLKLFRLPVRPLLFIAPRGLITILLFLSIPLTQRVEIINRSLVIQVIILTALVMMTGLLLAKPSPIQDQPKKDGNTELIDDMIN